MQFFGTIRSLFHKYWIPLVYITVGFAAYKIIADNYQMFMAVKPAQLFWLVACNVIFLMFYSLGWSLALRVMSEKRSSYVEGMALCLFHQFSYLSLGKGALVSTTSIIKDRYKTAYISSFSFFFFLTFVYIAINSIMGIMSVWFTKVDAMLVTISFVVLLALSILLAFIRVPLAAIHAFNHALKGKIPGYNGFAIFLLKASKMFTHFGFLRRLKYLTVFVVCTAVVTTTMVLRYYFAYGSLDGDVDFWQSGIVSMTTSNLLMFISITPGSLGVKEFFDGFFSNIVSVSQSLTISAALLDRVVNVICLVFSNFVAGYILFKTNKPIEEELETSA